MWRVIPVIISCLVLAAHFFRSAMTGLTIVCVVFAFLPFFRTKWVPLVMQFFLAAATIEWIRTLTGFAGERIAEGKPWIRLVLILGAVTLLTLLSGLVFRNRQLSRMYNPEHE